MSKTARQAERADCEECSGAGWRDTGWEDSRGHAVYQPCDMCKPPASVERICFEVTQLAARKPCRCGPDMCADSVACPRR